MGEPFDLITVGGGLDGAAPAWIAGREGRARQVGDRGSR